MKSDFKLVFLQKSQNTFICNYIFHIINMFLSHPMFFFLLLKMFFISIKTSFGIISVILKPFLVFLNPSRIKYIFLNTTLNLGIILKIKIYILIVLFFFRNHANSFFRDYEKKKKKFKMCIYLFFYFLFLIIYFSSIK